MDESARYYLIGWTYGADVVERGFMREACRSYIRRRVEEQYLEVEYPSEFPTNYITGFDDAILSAFGL